MAKIVLDEEPSYNNCPFMNCEQYSHKCMLANYDCFCIGGYRDSISFDFSRCHYCTTLELAEKEKKESEALPDYFSDDVND